MRLSRFVLGTIPIARLNESKAIEVIEHALSQGINFIDTARAYGDAEKFVGIALKNSGTKNVAIASKSMEREGSALRKDLEESLTLLGRESLDFFFLHQVDSFPVLEEIQKSDGALNAVLKAKEEGLIKKVGLSGHFTPVLEEAINELPLNILLGRFNLTMGIDEYKLIDKARSKGLTIAAMKIFEGGFITKNTTLCMRHAALNADLDHILIGCESKEQIDENLFNFNNAKPLDETEFERLAERAHQLNADSFCSYCGYCVAACPKNIPVSHIFNLQNKLSVYGKEYGFKGSPGADMYLAEIMGAIDLCDDCGKCESHCPNKFPIRKLLKEERAKFATFAEKSKNRDDKND
jgi:predicted aldo/keto reductase-like oxidoreductase